MESLGQGGASQQFGTEGSLVVMGLFLLSTPASDSLLGKPMPVISSAHLGSFCFMWKRPSLWEFSQGADEMAWSVKCPLPKQKGLFRSSAPISKLGIASVIPALARWRQVDPRSSLSSQPHILRSSGSVKDRISELRDGEQLRKTLG